MNKNRFNERITVYKNKAPRNRFPRWLVVLISGVLVAGIVIGAGVFWLTRSLTERFDILVVDGLIVDGTGSVARRETIGIRDGKFVRVEWPYFAEADKVINANGLIVAPGFIDAHTHIEGNLTSSRKGGPLRAPNFIAQGITTIITGNCGRSAASLSQFYSQLQAQGSEINIGSLVGHNTIRRQVMGETGRAATAEELRKMCEEVQRAMREGALGLSTGLEYTPGVYADRKEIQSLAAIAAQYHGIYATHMRDEGNGVIESLKESLAIAREANIPVEISHLKWRGRSNWGGTQRLIDMITEAQNAGLKVKCDIYPYTASSTTLDLLIPKDAREGGISKFRQRLKDAASHRRIIAGVLDLMRGEGWTDFAFARVAYCDFAPEYNGRTIPEITSLLNDQYASVIYSKEKDHSAQLLQIKKKNPTEDAAQEKRIPVVRTTAESQAETICHLASKGSVQMIYENMSEDDVANILRFPDCMLGSDSGIRNGEGRPHPRGYGSAPRLISLFAIKRGILSLEEAIRKMTSLPAETFGIDNRGKLLAGYWADLVIFDATSIKDEATYESPFRAPEGIEYVLVNGNVALDHGQAASINSGQIIRHGF